MEEIQKECEELVTQLSPEDQEKFRRKVEFFSRTEMVKGMIDLEIRRRVQVLKEVQDLIPEVSDRGSSQDMENY